MSQENQQSQPQYQVPKSEAHLYHVQLERVQFDQTTGARMSKPFTQTFPAKDFERFMKRSLEGQGYTITILHDPNVKVSTKAEGKPEANAPEATNE